MTKILKFGKFLVVLSALGLLYSSQSFAQQGTLRGGQMVLSNGSNAVTLKLPGSPKNWTFTLPKDTANGLQFLYDDGTGNMQWGVPASATSTGTVLYNVKGPQTLASGSDLFNIGYATTDPGPALGALIFSCGAGGSNTYFYGLTDTAENLKTSQVHAGTITALVDTVGNAGSGTQTGLSVTVSGGGTNYAFVSTAGNVGIGTAFPTEQLSDSGNLRISGVNGLKIVEGTNATMGTVVMNGVNPVVVNTNQVVFTAPAGGVPNATNSLIYLTPQNTGVCNCVGMPYVSAAVNGTSFTVQSTQAGDNSTVAWIIIQP